MKFRTDLQPDEVGAHHQRDPVEGAHRVHARHRQQPVAARPRRPLRETGRQLSDWAWSGVDEQWCSAAMRPGPAVRSHRRPGKRGTDFLSDLSVIVTGLAQKSGQLEAVNRYFQSKYWDNSRLWSQVCSFRALVESGRALAQRGGAAEPCGRPLVHDGDGLAGGGVGEGLAVLGVDGGQRDAGGAPPRDARLRSGRPRRLSATCIHLNVLNKSYDRMYI